MNGRVRRVWQRLQQRLSAEARVRRPLPVERLGTDYGGWSLATGALAADSLVYSVGVGDDVSFDLALIQRWGLTVHAFDPTPRSQAWLAAQRLPPQFQFHPWGLADYDGVAHFQPPADPRHVSYTLTPAAGAGGAVGEVGRLTTLMARLGHARLDVLKLDIEGAEYAVVADLVRAPAPIGQLLIEFHHRFPGMGWARTAQALRQLRGIGFEVAHVSRRGDEFLLAAGDWPGSG